MRGLNGLGGGEWCDEIVCVCIVLVRLYCDGGMECLLGRKIYSCIKWLYVMFVVFGK